MGIFRGSRSRGDDSLKKAAAKKQKRTSLLIQIALLFIVGVLLIGAISSVALYGFSTRYVRERLETLGNSTARDLWNYITDYPAYEWLLRYWYEHYDELDIEYDSIYTGGTKTENQYALLISRHPGFEVDYATVEDVETLPPEDQKLYAEIIYSWLIDRVDFTQTSFGLDYLFCVVTEEPYDRQFVLFIGAHEGETRGPGAGQVYPIGTVLPTSEEIAKVIREAVAGNPHAARTPDRKYFDFFYSTGSFDGHETLLVLSVNSRQVREAVVAYLHDFGFLFTSMMIALAVVCLLMIHYVVLQPLETVQKNISLYKDTKDSRTVAKNLSKIRSRNELEELSGDLAAMTKELSEYMVRNEESAALDARNKTELALAGRIQGSMLPTQFPPYPDRKDFEIYASMTPAREVGGDFYDFFLVDEDHLCLMIADASGKGIPAALFTVVSEILLEHNVKDGKSPAQVLHDVNNAICSRNMVDMFITVWLGILDLRSGEIVCSNAGHEYPMLKKPGGAYELVQDKHGFVLGGMEDVEYREYTLQLEPGGALFLYTDGLPEAVDPKEQMFGTNRVLEELNAKADRTPEETLQGMTKAVGAYVQGLEPFDDLTMIGLSYYGPEGRK